MEAAWLHALGKYKRGSRPRCVLLVDGTRHARDAVAAGLTDLVGLANVRVSPGPLLDAPRQTGQDG